MNRKIINDLEKQFTIVGIDFYEGDPETFFVFYANEVTEHKAYNLYNNYNELYNDGEYDGAFEDYLQEHNINYWILN